MASMITMTATRRTSSSFRRTEQVDGDADIAQRRPGQIKRDVKQEQRELERAEKRRRRQRQRHEKANQCRGDRQECIE